MPEPSHADRRKAAQLDPDFARRRLIDALERGWQIHFRCQFCGSSAIWDGATMLGRGRRYLACTMAELQQRLPCPRCPGRPPIMTMSGVMEPGNVQGRRRRTEAALRGAGLDPADYGYDPMALD